MTELTRITLTVWAILIGGAAILTPNGIIIIVENPPLRIVLGVFSLVIGIAGLVSRSAKTTRG